MSAVYYVILFYVRTSDCHNSVLGEMDLFPSNVSLGRMVFIHVEALTGYHVLRLGNNFLPDSIGWLTSECGSFPLWLGSSCLA